ncbi:MAG: TonB family protein [Cytophagales bacterium]|nr:TonB family protein [Cytophagales bacterium]
MSKQPTYRSDQEDFEKYFGDELSEKERHDLESRALEDAFEAEAMEGWEEVPVETAQADLTDLRERLQTNNKKSFNWIKIAAAIVLLLVASVVLLTNINQHPELMVQDAKAEESPVKAMESAKLKASAPIEKEQSPAPIPEESKVSEEIKEVISTPTNDDLLASTNTTEPDESLVDRSRVNAPVLQSRLQVGNENTVGALDVTEMDIVESDAEVPVQVLAAEGQDQRAVKLRQESTGFEVAANDYFEVKSKSGWNFRQIQGNVMDKNGEIVSDARIVLNGTPILAVSDLNGKFEMAIPDSLETPTLTFSSLGYNQLNYEINSRDSFDVVLDRDDLPELTSAHVSNQAARKFSTDVYDDNELSDFVSASPKVGIKKFEKYLKKNTHIPEVAKRMGVTGTVLISFKVNVTGELTDFQVIRGLGAGCDEEAVRVVKEGPQWTPATSGGQAVPVTSEVEVQFN